MRKRKRFLGILAFVMLMLVLPVTAQAEGKLNTACICGTEDAKDSFNKLADLIEDNKLSLWRNTKKNVRMTFDSENKGSTIEAVNRTLDRAFGNSTSNDINYLYLSGHGTSGSGDSNTVVYAKSGLELSNNCVYKFSDLVKKLIGYKGQFVIITDICYGGNIYRGGLINYPEASKRFTLLCGEDPYSWGWGIGSYQWYSSRLIKALSEYTNGYLKADFNMDGFLSVQEINDSIVRSPGLQIAQKPRIYGVSRTLLFQFGYVKMKEKSVELDLINNKSKILNVKRYKMSFHRPVMWKSSNPKVVSVDKHGKITALKRGTATITAYIEDPNGNMCLGSEDSCTVTVKVPDLRITPSSIRMVKGNTRQLSADVQGPSKKVEWKSSNTKVATVSSSGRVTAKRYGKAVIYAKANGITKKCSVTVEPSIRLDKNFITLYKDKTTKLYASVDGASKRVSWKSSNSSVASVDRYGRVRGRKKGRATIYARANGKTAKCSVVVKEKDNYKTLYRKFLSKSKIPAAGYYHVPVYFRVLNIDKKGVPELIVDCISERHHNGAHYLVYTVRNNRVCFMGSCHRKGVGPIVEYSPKYKGIYIDGWINGVGGVWSALYGVSGTKLVRKQHAEEYHPYRQNDIYRIGRTDKERRDVSKREYIAFVKKYMSGRKKYSMIRNTSANRNRYLK